MFASRELFPEQNQARPNNFAPRHVPKDQRFFRGVVQKQLLLQQPRARSLRRPGAQAHARALVAENPHGVAAVEPDEHADDGASVTVS